MSGKLAEGHGHYSQKSLQSTDSAKEDASMRHSARRLVPMGKGSFEKLAGRGNPDPTSAAIKLQMSTPNQEYSGGGDVNGQMRQLTERLSVSPWKEDSEKKVDSAGDRKARKIADLLGSDDNIEELEQQILNVEYEPREEARPRGPDLRRLSA